MDRFPDGTHVWRKCDGASMAQLYGEKDLPLLEPQMHQLFEGSGKAVGEFPLFYYLVGKTYQVAGTSNSIYRWWWWGILAIGFYCLFQWFYLKTSSTILSILLNIFCFTPPIVVYYGIEFLPDTIALALSFCGLYLYENAKNHSRKVSLAFGVLAFSLAMLTKISAGMLLIAIVTVDVFQLKRAELKSQVMSLLPWSIPFILVLVWIQYASWYNAQTNNVYFLLDTVPYWTLTPDQIAKVKSSFISTWYPEIFAYKSTWLLAVPFFASALLWHKKYRASAIPVVIYGLMVVAFVLLFFERFEAHDYYLICLYGLVPISLVFLHNIFNSLLKNRLLRFTAVLAIIPFVALNVGKAQKTTEKRKQDWDYYNHMDKNLTGIEDWLLENGVEKDEPILSVFDFSPNVSLYYMNRRGLTNLYNNELTLDFVSHARSIGIEHLIVHSQGLQNPENRIKYCSDTLSSYGNIHLFRLN